LTYTTIINHLFISKYLRETYITSRFLSHYTMIEHIDLLKMMRYLDKRIGWTKEILPSQKGLYLSEESLNEILVCRDLPYIKKTVKGQLDHFLYRVNEIRKLVHDMNLDERIVNTSIYQYV